MNDRKLIDLFPLTNQGTREIGIEIEMEGAALQGDFNYWKVTDDGSLRHNPDRAEYVLKTPVTRKLVESRLHFLHSRLVEQGAILNPSDRCGVHIHVNFQQNTVEEVFKFLTLYAIFEELLVKWCGEDREGNLFCLRFKDAQDLVTALVDAKERGTLRNVMNDHYRYAACNLAAIRKYGSLEFRAMRTQPTFVPINKWVTMLLRIKDVALDTVDPTAFVANCSAKGPENFAREILGPHYADLACRDMEDILMEGVRIAQHLAYTPLGEDQKAELDGLWVPAPARPRAGNGLRFGAALAQPAAPPNPINNAFIDEVVAEQQRRERNLEVLRMMRAQYFDAPDQAGGNP